MTDQLIRTINRIINDRSQIWSQYDAAVTEAQRLDKYKYFNNPNALLLPAPLSPNQTPPDEIVVTLEKLAQQLETIAQSQKNIEYYQTQIQENKKQFFIVMGIASAIILVGLLILFKK